MKIMVENTVKCLNTQNDYICIQDTKQVNNWGILFIKHCFFAFFGFFICWSRNKYFFAQQNSAQKALPILRIFSASDSPAFSARDIYMIAKRNKSADHYQEIEVYHPCYYHPRHQAPLGVYACEHHHEAHLRRTDSARYRQAVHRQGHYDLKHQYREERRRIKAEGSVYAVSDGKEAQPLQHVCSKRLKRHSRVLLDHIHAFGVMSYAFHRLLFLFFLVLYDLPLVAASYHHSLEPLDGLSGEHADKTSHNHKDLPESPHDEQYLE